MNEINLEKISSQVKELGVTSIGGFLKPEQFELANSILKNIRAPKGDWEGYFPVLFKNIAMKLIKFEFDIIKKSFLLKKIANDLQLKKIAERAFDHKVELHMIDSYYSEKSEENIIEWHNDIGWKYLKEKKNMNLNTASIKFFIYMTDVQCSNGSLAYIPNSHHIVRAITSLMVDGKIEFKLYWKLEDLRNLLLKKHIKDLIINKIGNEKIDAFLEDSKFIIENKKDTYKFDFEMDKGGVVIFDALGVHRGSMPSKNSRLVLRYHYRKKS